MPIPLWGSVRRAGRRLRNRIAPRAIILTYHRVTQLAADPWRLAVSPAHFAEQIEVLKKRTRVRSMTELATELAAGRRPKRGVVVTFDDGYEDNLRHAKPVLAKHGIPATVYATSGMVGRHAEYYWDELERILLSPGTLPERLMLVIEGRELSWTLRGTETYSQSAAAAHRHWHVDDPAPTTRHTIYRSLCQFIQDRPEELRRQVLDQLRAWAGVHGRGRATHMPLSADGLRRLADGGLTEIGSHSVTHALLAKLPLEQRLREIRQSKADLEELLGRPVHHFAYPYGQLDTFDQEAVQAVRDAGYASGACAFEGAVGRETDVYQLPRHIVRDWDGDEFARQLRQWVLDG